MTNDRFVDPEDHDPTEPTHPNVNLDDRDPKATRDFRIPSHVDLARIRYRYDPVYHEAINVAYRWFDDTETPEDVFDAYAGRRIRITRNLLGEEYYGGDVAPHVGVVTDHARTDALLDWVDDPPSAYAERETPEAVQAAIEREGYPAAKVLEEAVEAWKHGDVSRKELAAFVADTVDTDPVEAPSSDVEPGGSADETPTYAGIPRADVAFYVAAVVAFVLLTLALVYFF